MRPEYESKFVTKTKAGGAESKSNKYKIRSDEIQTSVTKGTSSPKFKKF